MKNNHKKWWVALLGGLCVAAKGYAAVDGTYTTAQVGVAGSVFNDTGPYLHFALGNQLNSNLALEGGVTAIPNGGDSGIDDLYSLDGDVKAMLPLGDRFNMYAKVGPSLVYLKDDDHDGMGIMANGAVGVAFNVTEHWTTDFSVGLMAGEDTSVMTTQLGFGYHFA
jgi:hypothetical protein